VCACVFCCLCSVCFMPETKAWLIDWWMYFTSVAVIRAPQWNSLRVVVTLERHPFSFDVTFQLQQRTVVARFSEHSHHTYMPASTTVQQRSYHLAYLTSSHLNWVAVSALWGDPVCRGCDQSERKRSSCLSCPPHSALTATQFRWDEVNTVV